MTNLYRITVGHWPIRWRKNRRPHVGLDTLLDPEFDDTDIAELTRHLVRGLATGRDGEDGADAYGTGWPAPEEEAIWQDPDNPD